MVLAEFQSHLEEKLIFLILEMKTAGLSGGAKLDSLHLCSPPLCQVLAAAFVPPPPLQVAQGARGLHSASLPSPTLLPPSQICGVLCYPPRVLWRLTALPHPLFGPALDVGFLLPLCFLTGFGGVQSLLYSFGERMCANT